MNQPLLEINRVENKQTCACCTSNRLQWTAGLTAFIALALFGVALFVPPAINKALQDGIYDATTLTPASMANKDEVFRTWADYSDPDAVPIYYTVYLMNITNGAAILDGSLAQITEKGPYVFREIKKRLNPTFTVDPYNIPLLMSTEWAYYIFDQHKSCSTCSLNDQFTTLNMRIQSLVNNNLAATLGYQAIIQAWDRFADYDLMFIKQNVSGILFGEYDEIYAQVAQALQQPTIFPGLVGNTTTPEQALTLSQPDAIYTGVKGYEALNRQYFIKNGVQTVYGQPAVLPAWNTLEASRIHGTDGNEFARNLNAGQSVNVFVSEVSRVVVLENVNSTTVDVNGVTLHRFTIAHQQLLNQTNNPNNAAYNMLHYNGVVNCTSITGGLPLLFTKPHFLDADPEVRSLVSGFSPADREAHDTFLDVELSTGVTMRGAKRLQVNIRPQPRDWSKAQGRVWFQKIHPELLIPVAWMEEAGCITDSKSNQFKDAVYTANQLAYYLLYVPFVVGCLLFASAVMLYQIAIARTKQQELLQHQKHFASAS